MIARTIGVGWQTILADLSLILFMVTASALAEAPDTPLGNASAAPKSVPKPAAKPAPPSAIAPLPRAEPVAVWRDGAGAPPLPQWLHDVARDPRLRLTITVHYAPGTRAAALAEAARLDRQSGLQASGARIVIEPGLPAGASAAVGFDADPGDAAVTANGTHLAVHGA
ncbi:hypothetical protein [Novosphingobium sp.]|uniref:hypothetical protein n=1 Tax=Novosphingobium sp. TaxID=1874826 RepID=UPI00333F8BE8